MACIVCTAVHTGEVFLVKNIDSISSSLDAHEVVSSE